jgi:GT2 family glycosyltransferase
LVEACRARDNVTLQCNDCNTGVAEGRNQASRLGRAPYIVALDNDAVFADPHQIARAVEIASADADLYALAFRIVRFDDGADDATSWSYPESMQECAALPFLTSRFVGAGHLLRRDAFEACGEYDPRLFFLHEELDLSYRLINAGGLIRYTPEVVVRHKVSAERRVWNHQRHMFHIRNSVYLMTK